MDTLFEVSNGYRKLKFPDGIHKIIVVCQLDAGVYADVVYDGGKCMVDTEAGTHTDMTTSWKENVRLIAIPLPEDGPLTRFDFDFSVLLNDLCPNLDYVKDYCSRMLIPYEDTVSTKERNNMQKRDSKGRFMKADKTYGRGCKRKHDTCKCSKTADSVKDEGLQLPVDCSNMSDEELEQFIKTLVAELANAVYIPGKTMTIDVTIEDNEDACTGDDDDADDDNRPKENFMDSFRAFLRERGVDLD